MMKTPEELLAKLRRAKSFGLSGYTHGGHEVATSVHIQYEGGESEVVELNDELRSVMQSVERTTVAAMLTAGSEGKRTTERRVFEGKLLRETDEMHSADAYLLLDGPERPRRTAWWQSWVHGFYGKRVRITVEELDDEEEIEREGTPR